MLNSYSICDDNSCRLTFKPRRLKKKIWGMPTRHPSSRFFYSLGTPPTRKILDPPLMSGANADLWPSKYTTG